MSNSEHLKILKQGVDVWNSWRKLNPSIRPNLAEASLEGANLKSFNLRYSNLVETRFHGANLQNASLGQNLMYITKFSGADLSWADLSHSLLFFADLSNTTFHDAKFEGTSFHGTNLQQANFSEAFFSYVAFIDVDLSETVDLETGRHAGPSSIGIDTIYKSKGKIPEAFLRGCGVPEDFITYARSLVTNPIEYYSCFISYSSKDKSFADRLHADLQAKNIRCWYAPEDLKIGEKFRVRIEESIRIYDKVMIVLSENSIQSAWVEDEVEGALEREHKNPGSLVLFPIRLDNAVMEQQKPGPPAYAAPATSATFQTGRTTIPTRKPLTGCCVI